MSLFGDFPDDSNSTNSFTPRSAARKGGNALFGSDLDAGRTDSPKPSSTLFSEEISAPMEEDNSPWGMPAPKAGNKARKSKREVLQSLLAGVPIPSAYERAFEVLLERGYIVPGSAEDGDGERINAQGVRFLCQEAGVRGSDKDAVERALGDALAEGLGKREAFVAIALVGLASESEEVGLDAVDERKRNLPVPTLPFLTQTPRDQEFSTPAQTPQRGAEQQQQQGSSPAKPRSAAQRKQSFGLDQDPWASPEMHRGHNHAATNGASAASLDAPNGAAPHRTTSTFTTSSAQAANTSTDTGAQRTVSSGSMGGDGWNDYNTVGEGFGDDSTGGAGRQPGHGGDGAGDNNPSGLGRPISSLRPQGQEEVVTITSIIEKEGMMFFQHRNYEVASVRRNSRVVRRYSDFVWLLDCLHKRFPFRALPLLPPKRVAINGNHIAADATFIEKRRRGLARFINALVRHPVLREEQLVVMFLTVPTELSVWRKQATISVQDEFLNKTLPPNLEDSLPADLQALFERVRSGVRRSAELYINMCGMIERLAKRQEGLAAEFSRIGQGLGTLTECSEDVYAADTNGVPLLNSGLTGTARHFGIAKSLLDDEVRAVDEGVLEDFKLQRDGLVSLRDLFERRDRLDKDDIPKLERRIASNETKLKTLRARPEGQGKPGDVEKVEEAIFRDQSSIVAAHARHVFIKQALKEEVEYFQQTQFAIARFSQDWAAERVKYAELQAENWRGAVAEVEGMVV